MVSYMALEYRIAKLERALKNEEARRTDEFLGFGDPTKKYRKLAGEFLGKMFKFSSDLAENYTMPDTSKNLMSGDYVYVSKIGFTIKLRPKKDASLDLMSTPIEIKYAPKEDKNNVTVTIGSDKTKKVGVKEGAKAGSFATIELGRILGAKH